MIDFLNKIEEITVAFQPEDFSIDSITLIPVDKNGREIRCFSNMHVGYPDFYQGRKGSHLDLRCWYSPLADVKYAGNRKHRLNKNRQGVYDCAECDFCLKEALEYVLEVNILINNEIDEAKIKSAIKPIVSAIKDIINAPLSRIEYKVIVGDETRGGFIGDRISFTERVANNETKI